jgi:phosphate transport system permease protein
MATATLPPPPPPPRPPAPVGWGELLFQAATRAAGVAVLGVVAALVAVLAWQAEPALARAGTFRIFTSAEWIPKPPDPAAPPTFGALAFVYGTVATAAVAMLLAVPLGVAAAAFLAEIAPPWLRKAGAFLIELLAAIPSVVYGFWGLFFLAPLLQRGFDRLGGPNTGGNGVLAAGLILAIMILPYITAIAFDVCRAVPRSQREGSLALGATRWQTIRGVVLPYARPGIVAAAFLALGRALGETMAVTMLIGNTAVIDPSVFARGDTIASKIANSLNEADDPTVRSALVALALVLLVVTGAFNVAARLLLSRLGRDAGRDKETRRQGDKETESPEPGGDADGGASFPVSPSPRLPVSSSKARTEDRVMTAVLGGCFVAAVVPLFLILGYVTVRGAGAVEWTLFAHDARYPNLTDPEYQQYEAWKRGEVEYPRDAAGRPVRRGGLGHAMLGSALVVGLATALAVPFGLMAAVYLAEARRSRLAPAVRFTAELLGGVPSIVIGIFAYAVLVYPVWLPGQRWGFSGWAGAFALAVMMVPVIVRSAEESMRLVPDALRQASYALGATRTQTTLRVVLPAALPAVTTGIFLAVGRIAGETAPLLLTAGQYHFWPRTPAADTPFLPGYIYTYSRSQYDDYQDQAWGGAVVLLAVVVLVNVGIRLLAGKRTAAEG